MPEKVVLAYSGGLDPSIIIPWLKENYAYDVIAMVGDVGQGDDLDAVVEKAYKTGASKVVVEDMREEFLREYVFPTLKAGAVYEHKYLLGTSMARPVIGCAGHGAARSHDPRRQPPPPAGGRGSRVRAGPGRARRCRRVRPRARRRRSRSRRAATRGRNRVAVTAQPVAGRRYRRAS